MGIYISPKRAYKHPTNIWKKFLVTVIIREMQIKATMRYHLIVISELLLIILKKRQVLVRMWRNWNPCTPSVEMQNMVTLSEVKVIQSYQTLCDPMDCSPWNSSGQNTGVGSLSLLQWIFLTQELKRVSCIAGGFFTNWAIREALIL